MARLSVNINKVALLRNARGGNLPNLIQVAKDCERFGAEGITVHPRPDSRHILYSDVRELKPILNTEFNIEGYPSEEWMSLVLENSPAQATLVPDPPGVLTSNEGWDTLENRDYLMQKISKLKEKGIRTSLFMETDKDRIKAAKEIGADRIELYTGPYAEDYTKNREAAVKNYVEAASYAREIGLGINAGHDLNLDNLGYLKQSIPFLDEVSIGHALMADALYFGLENAIQIYLKQLEA